MDSESNESPHYRTQIHLSESLDPQCMVCRRPFIPWSELNETLDPLPICRDCKSLFSDDNETVLIPRSRRRRRRSTHGSSDSVDSTFSQQFSHMSFDSNASIDLHSEIHSPLTDTDIDPMHAGLDQWDSDEQNDWELRLRVRTLDLFPDSDEIDLSPFTGNSGDYMDARGFEELLEQIAEADNSRRGAPPAAVSSVRSLPCVIISHDHEKNGDVVCAVCKDSLSVNGEARELPCSHLYHASCILPWLRSRNSCPVCRYELPTDDPEYEEGKHNRLRNVVDEIRVPEGFFDELSDVGEEDDGDDGIGESRSWCSGSNGGGNGRWILIAAAPILALVGIFVVKWVRSSVGGVRVYGREQCYGGMARRVNRSGRRWFLF